MRSPSASCLPSVLAALPALAVAAGLASSLAADDPPSGISARKLEEHVAFLARDELLGRDSGEPGLEVAAEYIALRFGEIGLEPAGDGGTYFQRFLVPFGADFGRVLGAVLIDERGREKTLAAGTQVIPFGYGGPGTGVVEAPVVFAGYGITTGDEDRKAGLDYDDYARIDVKGKVVIVLRHAPHARDGARGAASGPGSPRTGFGGDSPHAPLVAKLRNARSHGAAAVILVTPPGRDRAPPAAISKDTSKDDSNSKDRPGGDGTRRISAGDDLHGLAHRASPRPPTLPALLARVDAVDEILRPAEKDLASLEREIDEALAPRSFEVPGVRIRLDTTPGHRILRNVAGRLPGRGALAGESIVIGAHYDHIGRHGDQVSAKNLGLIHNGADDNASGVAGLIELARSFAAAPRPGDSRALLWVAFSGEEIGLLGSRAWLDAQGGSEQGGGAEPSPRIAAMVNLDMIGRAKPDLSVSVIGADSSPVFSPLLDDFSKALGVRVSSGGKGLGIGGSDHATFLLRSIPVLFFFTGMHKEYNTPADDAETLNYEGERRILELVRSVLEKLSTSPERPPFNAAALAASRGGHGKPRLGVLFDEGAEPGDGVRVRGVVGDTPAEKAGVKEGDVILGFGEAQIRSPRDLLLAVEGAREEEEVPLRVRRDDGDLVLNVIFPARRASFRVVFGSVPDYAFAEKGVRFESIRGGTPAEKAGVKAGDVLVRWAGKDVEDVEQWTALLGSQKPGDVVPVTVLREGKKVDLEVKLEAR